MFSLALTLLFWLTSNKKKHKKKGLCGKYDLDTSGTTAFELCNGTTVAGTITEMTAGLPGKAVEQFTGSWAESHTCGNEANLFKDRMNHLLRTLRVS